MPRTTCTACTYPIIPGVHACVNCGEPVTAEARALRDARAQYGVEDVDEVPAAQFIEENASARAYNHAVTEARSLELSGDAAGAVAIYERLVAGRCAFSPPYQRLAILYARAKRPAEEERAVRAALAVIPQGPNGWFVVRLAKILGRARRATP